MPKKFFDILPPARHSKLKEKKWRGERAKASKVRFGSKEGLIAGLVFVIILAVFSYFKLPRLNLEIWPNMGVLSFKEKITVDINASGIDLAKNIIPGKVLQEQKDLWKEFTATGVIFDEGKARGKIRVYNEYNPSTPITLREKTRFLSEKGKYFLALQKVSLPAAEIKKGKVSAGWTDVEIEALETGEDYNISSATFSVPGLAGTPYYHTIYAEIISPLTGGYKKELKQVTEEDIKQGQKAVGEELLASLESILKKNSQPEFVLLENALSKEIIESASLVKAGSKVDQFSVQAKAKATALVFKKADAESFAKEFLISHLLVSKKLFEKSLVLNYTPELIDIKGGKIIMNLDFSAQIYPDINKGELTILVFGKSSPEIKEMVYRNLIDQISKVEIKFWPFWVRKAPKDIERIKIDLNLE